MVYGEGVPIVMIPLDLTHTVLIKNKVMESLTTINSKLSLMLREVFEGLKKR